MNYFVPFVLFAGLLLFAGSTAEAQQYDSRAGDIPDWVFSQQTEIIFPYQVYLDMRAKRSPRSRAPRLLSVVNEYGNRWMPRILKNDSTHFFYSNSRGMERSRAIDELGSAFMHNERGFDSVITYQAYDREKAYYPVWIIVKAYDVQDRTTNMRAYSSPLHQPVLEQEEKYFYAEDGSDSAVISRFRDDRISQTFRRLSLNGAGDVSTMTVSYLASDSQWSENYRFNYKYDDLQRLVEIERQTSFDGVWTTGSRWTILYNAVGVFESITQDYSVGDGTWGNVTRNASRFNSRNQETARMTMHTTTGLDWRCSDSIIFSAHNGTGLPLSGKHFWFNSSDTVSAVSYHTLKYLSDGRLSSDLQEWQNRKPDQGASLTTLNYYPGNFIQSKRIALLDSGRWQTFPMGSLRTYHYDTAFSLPQNGSGSLHALILPVPAVNACYLTVYDPGATLEFGIVDMLGRCIRSWSAPAFDAYREDLDVSSWSSGTYFIKIRSEDRSWTGKLIVAH